MSVKITASSLLIQEDGVLKVLQQLFDEIKNMHWVVVEQTE